MFREGTFKCTLCVLDYGIRNFVLETHLQLVINRDFYRDLRVRGEVLFVIGIRICLMRCWLFVTPSTENIW